MAGEYTVKILDSEEFNKLPFKRIQDNPDSVYGAADKKNRIAYVRDTGYNDITKANIGHELDELMQDVSEHEEDGIRYKDFSQSFGNFGSKIPVIGKLTGGLGKMFGGGIDMLGSGASKLGLPNFNIGNQSAGQMGPVYGPQTQTQASTSSGINKASQGTFGDAWKSGVAKASAAPRAGGVPTSTASSGGGNWWDSLMGGVGDMFGGSGGGGDYDFVANGKSGGGTSVGGFDLGQQLKGAAPGAIVSMLGNLFTNKVDSPDFSGVGDKMESRIGGKDGLGSEPFNLGMTEARRQLGTEPGTIPPAVLAEYDLREKEEIENLTSRFRGAQGSGEMSESDTSRYGTLRAEIVRKWDQLKNQAEFEYQNAQEARHIETMQTVLNLDQAQFNQYAQLANLEISEIMMRYGNDVQTATQFKELFGNIGGSMMDNAFQQQQA